MAVCLLVEDSKTQRNFMKKIAESCDLDVIEAVDGIAGIEACEENIPDIILLDMNMPSMGGIEFLTALKQIPKDITPHIIICSATINKEDIISAKQNGANEYYQKSMDLDELRKKIMNAPILKG